MPAFTSYKRNSVANLLKLRETGRSINMFGTTAFSLNNNVSDLEFVRSLLCDKSSYLEVSALIKTGLTVQALDDRRLGERNDLEQLFVDCHQNMLLWSAGVVVLYLKFNIYIKHRGGVMV